MTDRTSSHEDLDDRDATFMPETDGHAMPIGPLSGADESTKLDPFTTFAPAERDEATPRSIRYDALVRGDQIGDFRILRLLGQGSFGAVYLARELTLDRLVALKVVLPEGQLATAGEGRSLARLKHPNIVGVYGEARDRASGCSCMWMQYVDGSNMANLIERLHDGRSGDWVESDLLRLLSRDQNFKQHAPRRNQDRGSLETVCRIGRQLGEALMHAHQSGVTHRDIKPANILMQRDGTPLLADFNLADNASDDREKVTGGTIAYMPPEQFEQLLGERSDFDACRADIYSLGVVLWELACGCRPHAEAESSVESSGGQRLKDYLRIRKDELPKNAEDVHIGLAMILWRAMSVAPQKRYPSAKAMATALAGLAELQRARRKAPTVAGLLQFVRRNLVWIMLFGGLLPHFAASGLQSFYNQIWIGTSGEAFTKAFIAYNIVVYPACVGWIAWNLYNFARGYRQVITRQPVARSQLRKLRKRLLRLPRQLMIASAVGWFPGVVLFPWLLGIYGHPPSTSEWFHYGISFTIAGLIATTYSYAFVLYVVICHGYRACWQTASHYRWRARYELSGMEKRIRIVSILVGVLPLAAAVLLLAIGMPSLDVRDPKHWSQMQGLHQLVIALIVAGAIGLYVVETAAARLIRVIRALTLADD